MPPSAALATFPAFGLQSYGLRLELISDTIVNFSAMLFDYRLITFANAAFGGIGDLFGLRPSKLRPSAGADQ